MEVSAKSHEVNGIQRTLLVSALLEGTWIDDFKTVSKLIRLTSTCCRVPEPIRVARLIAWGLTHRVL